MIRHLKPVRHIGGNPFFFDGIGRIGFFILFYAIGNSCKYTKNLLHKLNHRLTLGINSQSAKQ